MVERFLLMWFACERGVMAEPTLGSKGAEHFGQHTRFQYRSVCVTPPDPKKLGRPSHLVAHAHPVHLFNSDGGRRRWFRAAEKRSAP